MNLSNVNPEALTATGLLTVAVVALWGVFMKKDKEATKRLDDCEEDREKINTRLHKLEVEQAVFHACIAKPCPAKEAVAAQIEFSKQTHNED